jgi:hypothetical protein
MVQSTKTLAKSIVVNYAFNQDFEGVRWLERSHSCPYKPHLAFQRSRLKDLRSNKKFPKIEMTCNFHLPKMESSSPQNYMSKQASNQILSNMKVEDLALAFPKSPRTLISHFWLASYDQIIFRKS